MGEAQRNPSITAMTFVMGYAALHPSDQTTHATINYTHNKTSRVRSSAAFSGGLGLPLVIIDPLLGEPV